MISAALQRFFKKKFIYVFFTNNLSRLDNVCKKLKTCIPGYDLGTGKEDLEMSI